MTNLKTYWSKSDSLSASIAATAPANTRRRRLLLALAAAPLAGSLALRPKYARAAAHAAVLEGRDRWLFPGWESLTDDDTAACLNVVDLIGKTAGALAARGIHCTAVIAPLKARAAVAELPADRPLSEAVTKRYGALRAHGKQIGLDILDGEAALAHVDTTKDTTYIRADYHWSAHTAEAFAAASATRLLASGAIKRPQTQGTALGDWTEEYNWGDLATLLPPDRRRVIGRDRFVVRQQADSGGLLATSAPVVQVVGNSMVQPYLGFPQKLSNALGRPVGLSWTFGDTGPWKTLLDYLESPTFGKQKPEAIVWQFNEGQMKSGPDANGEWDASSIMSTDTWFARVSKALAG